MGVVTNEINIDKLKQEMAGIEANTAGLMTSVKKLSDRSEGFVGKNLLYNYAKSKTESGVTLTVNADGSVTVSTGDSGATARVNFKIGVGDFGADNFFSYSEPPVKNGFVISDGKNGGKASDAEANNTFYLGYNATYKFVQLVIMSGQIFTDPMTFYPMIRYEGEEDPTYEKGFSNNLTLSQYKVDIDKLKEATSGASDFAAFKSAIAAL